MKKIWEHNTFMKKFLTVLLSFVLLQTIAVSAAYNTSTAPSSTNKETAQTNPSSVPQIGPNYPQQNYGGPTPPQTPAGNRYLPPPPPPPRILRNTYTYVDTYKDTQKKSKLDEAERNYLKAKYSDILSSKNMSNDQKCSAVASYYQYSSYEELERVLNTILRLGCSMEKLR